MNGRDTKHTKKDYSVTWNVTKLYLYCIEVVFFSLLFVKANQISMQNFISSVQMAPSMGQRLIFLFTMPIRWSFDVWLDSFCSLPYKFWGFRFIFCWITNYSVMLAKMRAAQTKAQKCAKLFDWRSKLCRMKCSKYGFNFNELKNVHIPFKQAFDCYWLSIFVFFLPYLICIHYIYFTLSE